MAHKPLDPQELTQFFKALSDPNRLKIVGLLAQEARTVEQLAALLGLGASTTSHHLSRLTKAGLVSARAEGHYARYSLQTETLKQMARRLDQVAGLPGLAEYQPAGYDAKVLKNFTGADGRIHTFPAQEKKLLVLLRHVLQSFEPGVRYTEKQVNEILSRFNDDTAFLRRSLVSFKMMARQGGGGEYWVNPGKAALPESPEP